ncbi:hypothetical protein RCL1_002939 [Eukaryota sp. TZLM3-RCL]
MNLPPLILPGTVLFRILQYNINCTDIDPDRSIQHVLACFSRYGNVSVSFRSIMLKVVQVLLSSSSPPHFSLPKCSSALVLFNSLFPEHHFSVTISTFFSSSNLPDKVSLCSVDLSCSDLSRESFETLLSTQSFITVHTLATRVPTGITALDLCHLLSTNLPSLKSLTLLQLEEPTGIVVFPFTLSQLVELVLDDSPASTVNISHLVNLVTLSVYVYSRHETELIGLSFLPQLQHLSLDNVHHCDSLHSSCKLQWLTLSGRSSTHLSILFSDKNNFYDCKVVLINCLDFPDSCNWILKEKTVSLNYNHYAHVTRSTTPLFCSSFPLLSTAELLLSQWRPFSIDSPCRLESLQLNSWDDDTVIINLQCILLYLKEIILEGVEINCALKLLSYCPFVQRLVLLSDNFEIETVDQQKAPVLSLQYLKNLTIDSYFLTLLPIPQRLQTLVVEGQFPFNLSILNKLPLLNDLTLLYCPIIGTLSHTNLSIKKLTWTYEKDLVSGNNFLSLFHGIEHLVLTLGDDFDVGHRLVLPPNVCVLNCTSDVNVLKDSLMKLDKLCVVSGLLIGREIDLEEVEKWVDEKSEAVVNGGKFYSTLCFYDETLGE